ncbi:MAG: hypothetical protein ACTSX7_16765 [Alphaproteobacteria bacterium]
MRPLSSQANQSAQPGLSPQQWRDDLHFLSRELRNRQPTLMHTLSDRTFERAINVINRALPHLPAHGIAAAFSELVSMIRLRDTSAAPPSLLANRASRLLPMRLHEFPEGLMITQAPAQYRQLRGARLLKIDGTAIATIIAALHPLVASDDLTSPDPTLPLHLIASETLHGLGLTEKPHRVTVSLETAQGARRDVAMNAMAAPFYGRWANGRLLGLPQHPPITYLSHPDTALWFALIQARETLFIQINRPPDSAHMHAAIAALTSHAEHRQARDVVIDLRLCQHQDSQQYEPLLQALTKQPVWAGCGQLYVITRRRRAPHNAELADALSKLGALIVAEPSIEFDEHYREAMPVMLPNSGIALHLSRHTWRPDPAMTHAIRQPDIPFTKTAADFFADIDPALTAIQQYQQVDSYQDVLQTA